MIIEGDSGRLMSRADAELRKEITMLDEATFTDDLMATHVIEDPYSYYADLRQNDPIHWNPEFGGWIVTRHSDVVSAFRRPEHFSSAVAALDTGIPYPPISELDETADADARAFLADLMLEMDPPEHSELRDSLRLWFTPKRIEDWRATIREDVNKILNTLVGRKSMEVKEELATPIPLLFICRMLSIPEVDAPYVHRLANTIAAARSTEPNRLQEVVSAYESFRAYFAPIIDKRSATPGDDLVSMLIDAHSRGICTESQMYANLALLVLAGHDTTVRLISSGTLLFLNNPEQWDLLRSDPDTFARTATEECLRCEPPVKSLWRIAIVDTELGGREIAAGDRLLLVMAAANRDPDVFDDPDAFDIMRAKNPHVTFAIGIHHCLGAALARLEGQEVFRALAETFPRLRLAPGESITWLPRPFSRQLQTLNVCWD